MASILEEVQSANFLAGPAPANATKKIIDFAKSDVAEYKALYAAVIDDVLTAEECQKIVRAAELKAGGTWERAMVNAGGGRQVMYEDIRKSGRIIWDDADLMDRIWKRCEPLVPELQQINQQPKVSGLGPYKRREIWKFTRCNERMRILKYTTGEYFQMHCDGCYETPDGTERSYYTLHLYLNDTNTQDDGGVLEGGATTFWAMDEKRNYSVQPKIGSVLIFQHRNLLHSGDEVSKGMKITMRTDLMYTLADELADPPKEENPNGVKRAWKWAATKIGA